MLRKLGANYQIAIPKEVVKNLHLHKNDYLDVQIVHNGIYLKPHVSIPKDQAYFFTPEWQKGEKEAEEDIKAGRVTKTKNLEELFDILDGKKDYDFDH
ncbi:MAG: AbrB/MazE/SpoVT family DNA-binding domain-containing protein [Candidatus Omnitrophica bacterium]|nr:AbrB/MazE/SpoVT family DNA-binding domain-containing protein [Candidatus Omnitrophota bacterium]